MLELDCMLQGFFKQSIESLSGNQLTNFESLLESPDDLLLEYLMGRTIPMDAGLANIVKQIRQSTQN
jgi:succinate dehydrogenase flavin-adding protein (antitoxin of CptAB toxin-antitoxin module)